MAGLVLEASWLSIRLTHFAILELAAAAALVALLWFAPALRLLLVPKSLRYRAAHANALRQFLARNIHATAARTGVLIFVSLAERYAEVIADAGINEKVPQEAWNDIVAGLVSHARQDRLAEGYLEAIAAVGERLAAHFPPGPETPTSSTTIWSRSEACKTGPAGLARCRARRLWLTNHDHARRRYPQGRTG